ncbi:MAG: hypothetical protein KC636_37655, partial [Myxococcales bacterium]|nr:hypothetical protein [Myxococcales bacterium]
MKGQVEQIAARRRRAGGASRGDEEVRPVDPCTGRSQSASGESSGLTMVVADAVGRALALALEVALGL